MATDYKDKIRKLLALAGSSNENEAREAMLRAQELMAKHKLTEADLSEPVSQNVQTVWTDITCSKRREPWLAGLAQAISDNYCCYGIRRHMPKKQTQYIGFVGLEDDVEICTEVFKYAVDCVRSAIQQLRRTKQGCFPEDYVYSVCVSYGIGFTQGLLRAFHEQKEQNAEWGLVLVKPREVNEAVSGLGREKFKTTFKAGVVSHIFHQGFDDGLHFDPKHRLPN